MSEELRRPSSILKELDHLHELIEENRQLVEGNPSEFALQLNLISFENREKALIDELSESYNRLSIDSFDLDVEGDNVENHRISSSVLGKMLVDLQGVIDSVAYCISDVQYASRGPIPQSVLSGSRIDVAAACLGSFRVILTSNQPALGESLAKMALRRFNGLLDCKDDKELIRQEIRYLGIRAISRYKIFMEDIYKTNSRIKLYDSVIPEGFETKVITPELAKSIRDVIDHEESIPDEEQVFAGTVKGLSLIKYSYQFLVDDSEDVISGNFDPKLSESVKNMLDKHSEAVFRISTKLNEITDELTPEYELLGFNT